MEFLFGRCKAPIPSVIAAVFVAASLLPSSVAAADGGQEDSEYLAIKQRLARGWNTWNTRSVLAHTLLPEGFALNLAFKQVKWLVDLTEEVERK
jgi:hypothetical protein